MDMKLVEREAWRPVGGHIAQFRSHWQQMSSNQWILNIVSRYGTPAIPWVHNQLEEKYSLTNTGTGVSGIPLKVPQHDHCFTNSEAANFDEDGQTDEGAGTTIQDLACVLGMMMVAHPGILPAPPLHYRPSQ